MDMLRGGNKSQPRGDNSIDKYRNTQGRGYPNAGLLSGLMLTVGICAFTGILLTLLFTTGMVVPLVVGWVLSLIGSRSDPHP